MLLPQQNKVSPYLLMNKNYLRTAKSQERLSDLAANRNQLCGNLDYSNIISESAEMLWHKYISELCYFCVFLLTQTLLAHQHNAHICTIEAKFCFHWYFASFQSQTKPTAFKCVVRKMHLLKLGEQLILNILFNSLLACCENYIFRHMVRGLHLSSKLSRLGMVWGPHVCGCCEDGQTKWHVKACQQQTSDLLVSSV